MATTILPAGLSRAGIIEGSFNSLTPDRQHRFRVDMASDVGTEQDVILAERDVEMARTRQEQTRTRVPRCRSEAGVDRPPRNRQP